MKRNSVFSVRNIFMLTFAVLVLAALWTSPCCAAPRYGISGSSVSDVYHSSADNTDTLTIPVKDPSRRLNERRTAPAILSFGADAVENEGVMQRARIAFSPSHEKAPAADLPDTASCLLSVSRSEVSYISNISSSLYTKTTHKIE